MEYWVRNASNKDTDGLVHVIHTVYLEFEFDWHPETYHADLYDIEKHYWRLGHTFWVAETLDEDPKIIGTCALHTFTPIALGQDTVEIEGMVRIGGTDCSLERMYVLPEARGQGVAMTMLSHAVAFARERNLKRMEIWSDKAFDVAHKLYQKVGAQMVGDRLCHDPAQSPEWGMILDIRNAKL